MRLVAVQLSVPGLYLPPVLKELLPLSAPDDHFTTGPDCGVIVPRAGALVMLVAAQLSVPGLYLPPVLNSISSIRPRRSFHYRSRLPCERSDQVARWLCWLPSRYQ